MNHMRDGRISKEARKTGRQEAETPYVLVSWFPQKPFDPRRMELSKRETDIRIVKERWSRGDARRWTIHVSVKTSF